MQSTKTIKDVPQNGVQKWYPILGYPCIFAKLWGARFWGRVLNPKLGFQALAFYRWTNGVLFSPDTHDPVLVNVDECSVKFVLDPIGTVLRQEPLVGHKASLSTRRTAVTFIAAISSDPFVNQTLPQILLTNKSQISKLVLEEFAKDTEFSKSLTVWRETSSWVNSAIMVRYLHALSETLDCSNRTVVLFWDMATPHLDDSVYCTARDLNIRIIPVPAKCTPYLQPLDCFVFSHFRQAMATSWVTSKGSFPEGRMSKIAWLKVVAEAVRKVILDPDWSLAFQRTGILDQQKHLSKTIMTRMGWTAGAAPASLPTVAQAAACFPRSRRIHVAKWLYWKDTPWMSAPTVLD